MVARGQHVWTTTLQKRRNDIVSGVIGEQCTRKWTHLEQTTDTSGRVDVLQAISVGAEDGQPELVWLAGDNDFGSPERELQATTKNTVMVRRKKHHWHRAYLRCIIQKVFEDDVQKVVPYDEDHAFFLDYAKFCCVYFLKVLRLNLQHAGKDLNTTRYE